MNNRILVADDEELIHRLLRRALPPELYGLESAATGEEALSRAREEQPALILLDLNMPGRGGMNTLIELRRDPRTRMVPVIIISGEPASDEVVRGLENGADDYVAKPFRLAELAARVASVLRRNRRDVAASPLTRLPGSPTVEEDINRRIAAREPFACMYIDLDRFKAYNDVYGYAKGDTMIRETATILSDAVRAEDARGGLVGHIGGDDFIVLCEPAAARRIARDATAAFDLNARKFYLDADLRRGFTETRDRRGKWRRFPLVSLSIGAVTTEARRLDSYARVAELASEMKSFVKSRANSDESAFLFDRRKDW